MKKARKKLPRKWKLLVESVLLLLLLCFCWILQDCPRFTAAAAFRRVLKANFRPEASLVLRLPMDDGEREWGVGYSSGKAYEVFLKRSRLSWQNGGFCGVDANDYWWSDPASLLEFPASEGVCCVPLFWYGLIDPTQYPAPDPETPALAVKAEKVALTAEKITDQLSSALLNAMGEAVRAEATLRVEAWEPFPDTPQLNNPAGSCELVFLREEAGWFLFGFDAATLRGAGVTEARSVNRSLTL